MTVETRALPRRATRANASAGNDKRVLDEQVVSSNGNLDALEPGMDPIPTLTAALEALGEGIEGFGFQLTFGHYAPAGRVCEFRVKGVGMAEFSKRLTAWLDGQGSLDNQIQVVDEGSGELTLYLLEG